MINIDTFTFSELQEMFADVLNYEADDPFEKINPLTYRSPEGDSCLHIAAMRGNYRAVELLIKAGLDVNQVGDMGNTPLHYAKKFGHHDVASLLFQHGASVELRNDFGELPQE